MNTSGKSNIALSKKPVSRYQGVTLMELMVVLAITAIILTIGAPSMVNTLNRNAQINSVNGVISGISTARTHAVTYKRPFVIEALDDDWSKGFNIKPGSVAGEPISVNEYADDTEISITSDAGDFILFNRLGKASPANSEFVVCNGQTGKGIAITVNIFGKTEVDMNEDNDTYNFRDC